MFLPSLSTLPLLLLSLYAPPALAESPSSTRLSTSSHTLYTRLLSPSDPVTPWGRRGTVYVDAHSNEASFEPSLGPHFQGQGTAYQIGLGTQGGEEPIGVVVVDACVLLHEGNVLFEERLSLKMTAQKEVPHFTYETNSNVGCGAHERGSLERGSEKGEIKVEVVRGYVPDPPRFKVAAPVIVDREGKIVPPPMEKSFVQKYWIYSLPIIAILLIGGGPEEEPAKK